MLLQEWNWDDARAVWEREAEERADAKWQSIVADKDAILADKDAKWQSVVADKDAIIAKLKAQLDKNH